MAENEVPVLSQTKLSTLPNSPFPTRILKLIRDEEEWLSESELKTDNSSSSDDEMSPTSQNLDKKFNKIKKRRKSKVNFKESADKKDDINNVRSSKSRTKHSVSSLNENVSGKLLRGTGDGKSSSLLSTSIAESDEDDNEIYWRPKRETASLNLLRDHPDLTDSFAKTEEHLENVSAIDRADDFLLKATKRMQNLEWALLQAECTLEKEKGETAKIAIDMEEFLFEIYRFEGDAWNYIRDVIKQWIYYLKYHEIEQELGNERFVSKRIKHNYKNLVRNRIKSKLTFIEKNIEAAKLTKLKSNLRLPKLSKEDKLQLDELVKNSKNFALNEYKLQKSELDKLKEINSKLSLHRLDSGASVVLNSSNKDELKLNKLMQKSQKLSLNKYNLQKFELDRLKDINWQLAEHERARNQKNVNVEDENERQLEDLFKKFAIHEYNLPKFELEKLKQINSRQLLH